MKLGKLADMPQLHIHLDQLPDFDLTKALETGIYIRWKKDELFVQMRADSPTPP